MNAKQAGGAFGFHGFKRRAGTLEESSLIDTIFRNELFAYQPVPRFHKGQYGTLLGVICTLLVLVGMGTYVTVTTMRFLEENVSISVETLRNTEGMEMVPITLSIPHINDIAWFEVRVEHRHSPGPGQRAKKTIMPTTTDGKHWMLIPTGGYTLKGNCRVQSCNYVRIKIFPCENGTTVLLPNMTCAPLEDITNVVSTNYLETTLNLTLRKQSIPDTTVSSLKTAASIRKQVLFDIKETITYPNFFNTFSTKKYSELSLLRETFDIDRIPRPEHGEDRELAKLDFSLSSNVVKENVNPQTALDLFGSWAAFFAALVAVFRLFVHKLYNKEQFYKEYPHWAGFDDDFIRYDQYESPEKRGGSEKRVDDENQNDGHANGSGHVGVCIGPTTSDPLYSPKDDGVTMPTVVNVLAPEAALFTKKAAPPAGSRPSSSSGEGSSADGHGTSSEGLTCVSLDGTEA